MYPWPLDQEHTLLTTWIMYTYILRFYDLNSLTTWTKDLWIIRLQHWQKILESMTLTSWLPVPQNKKSKTLDTWTKYPWIMGLWPWPFVRVPTCSKSDYLLCNWIISCIFGNNVLTKSCGILGSCAIGL